MELIGFPAQFRRGAHPFAEKSTLVIDLGAARHLLGCGNVVGPEEAARRTARWLAECGGEGISPAFAGSFDCAAEDAALVA